MPAPGHVAIHHHVNRQAARRDLDNSAQPRPARVRFAVRTTGIGESRLQGKSRINFGAYMLDEPTFSYGVVAQGRLRVGQLPLATATVLTWHQTKTGLYYAADMGFKIESLLYSIRLKFTLTFEGSTMRVTGGGGTGNLYQAVNNPYKGSPDATPDDYEDNS